MDPENGPWSVDWNALVARIQEMVVTFGVRLLAAVAILLLGWWAAKFFRMLMRQTMHKAKAEPTVVSFATNLLYAALLIVVVIAALAKIGMQTSSLVAMLAAAGLAIGLALQGSLSNFAAGFLIVLYKPIRVGDYVEGGGVSGSVVDINIFSTTMNTPDNKRVIVPNSKLTSDVVTNYSINGTRRMDLIVGASYGDDAEKVKKILREIVEADERIFKDPEPIIALLDLADSSVNYAVRFWVNGADYWPIRLEILETVKKRFDAEGVTIPFPQRVMWMEREAKE